jgi:dihydrofolate reductase
VGSLTVSAQMSVDGVIDPIDWFDRHGAHEQAAFDDLVVADALLLGRKTYEGLASVWTPLSGDGGWADRVNAIPKYVVTRGEPGPLAWNGTAISGLDEVPDLAKRYTLISYGCGELAYHLAMAGLVDHVQLWMHTTVWGPGTRPFHGLGRVPMRLVSTTAFDSGVVRLDYRPTVSTG